MKTKVENNTAYLKQFEEIYRKYYPQVLSFIYSKVRNVYLAEDLTQETFLRVFEYKYLPDEEKGKFFNFLCTIARSRIYSHRKKIKEKQIFEWVDKPDESFNIEQAIIKREFKEVLYKIILSLPEMFKYPCLLFSIMGYSYKEASEECGITVGCFKSRLLRARYEIRKRLNNFYG